ncbi:MAG: hypothetical protein UR73_C0037G0018 [candidate division WS6 bacterium GW2011_GWF1_35_23]|uniref:Uncharacterized protein n=1 Tax=candidate division WS6 bacterium GW2011_GWF1_35_23 TaxID=1619097 RepID=A0A0G0BZA4_9BACT|nr:MAG: hypothetical protein UR73_C0037G0018 [candidate division WS6 bacterium GW2011_GWF1_35_23]
MNFEYVKSYYKVPAELGREIMLRDRKGIIVEDRGHYIGVTFDDENPGTINNLHPTFEVKYLGIGKIRKVKKSTARYKRYLEYGDSFDSFLEYCKWDGMKERSWNI